MRPPRLPREEYKGWKTVAATINVVGRKPIFTSEPLVRDLALILNEEILAFGCRSPIYVFMPDHFHLMVQGMQDDADLLTPLERIKLRAGILLSMKKVPAKLQSGFYDHIVRCGDDWRNQAKYIAFNPVRRGLAQDPFEYPFIGVEGEDRDEMLKEFLCEW